MSAEQEKRQVPLCAGFSLCVGLLFSQNHLMKLMAFSASFADMKAPEHQPPQCPSPTFGAERPGFVPSPQLLHSV